MITKSKYLNGLKCPKLLWIDCNERERIPEPDISQQHRFDEGRAVEKVAKRFYPQGINVGYSNKTFLENIKETENLLPLRKVLFEAGILVDNVYSRIDILEPSENTTWNIVEVKSSISIKKVYLYDVAFQKFCCQKKGLKINKCFILYINNKYVRNGDLDPEEFFVKEDITEQISPYFEEIEDNVNKMREIISGFACPETDIGPYCSKPYDCSLMKECRAKLGNHHIFTLYRYGDKKCFPLYENGITNIQDIPDEELGLKQLIQKKCVKTGKPYINRESIASFFADLEYPIYFMDFETINPAVPIFEYTRPYQRIPFQFSVHILKSKTEQPLHYKLLCKNSNDPSKDFVLKLKEALGEKGTIIVYNRSFEESVLKELAEAFPEYNYWVQSIKRRIKDLLQPFRNFDYYSPTQEGSASIKKVLPAITGNTYDEMEISAGGDASALYFQVTHKNPHSSEKDKVYSDLEKYCALDTEGMVWILNKLGKYSETV